MIEMRDSTAEPQSGVQCSYGKSGIAPEMRRDEWIDFMRVLRRAFLMIVRWIEKCYPEIVS